MRHNTKIMVKAAILSLEQTDAAGLFTIIFNGESQSEFVKFVNKFRMMQSERMNFVSFLIKLTPCSREVLKNEGFALKEK